MDEVKEILHDVSAIVSGESAINVEVSLEPRAIMWLCVGLLSVGVILIGIGKGV